MGKLFLLLPHPVHEQSAKGRRSDDVDSDDLRIRSDDVTVIDEDCVSEAAASKQGTPQHVRAWPAVQHPCPFAVVTFISIPVHD